MLLLVCIVGVMLLPYTSKKTQHTHTQNQTKTKQKTQNKQKRKVADIARAMQLGRDAAALITAKFPPPVKLEFEKVGLSFVCCVVVFVELAFWN